MSRILLYGSFVALLAIGSFYYIQGAKVQDALLPLIAMLLAVMSYGYGEKAKEDGDFGTGNNKIRRDRSPKIFQIAIYINYLITAGFLGWAVYLLVK